MREDENGSIYNLGSRDASDAMYLLWSDNALPNILQRGEKSES